MCKLFTRVIMNHHRERWLLNEAQTTQQMALLSRTAFQFYWTYQDNFTLCLSLSVIMFLILHGITHTSGFLKPCSGNLKSSCNFLKMDFSGQHGDLVVSTVTSQKEVPGSELWDCAFVWVSSHSSKICTFRLPSGPGLHRTEKM